MLSERLTDIVATNVAPLSNLNYRWQIVIKSRPNKSILCICVEKEKLHRGRNDTTQIACKIKSRK